MWSPAAFKTTSTSACRGTNAVSDFARSGGRRAGRRGPVGFWPIPAAGVNGCTAADFGAVTPAEAETKFILDFATRYYGGANASVPAAVADVYGRYFNISYMSIDTVCTSVPTCNLGDHYLGTTLRGLTGPFDDAVTAGVRPAALAKTAQPLIDFADANLPYLEDLFTNRVLPLQPYIPSGQPAGVYASHVVMQAAVHYYHVLAFQATAAGALAYLAGDDATAASNVSAAVAAFDAMLGYMRAGEGEGVWRGVYAKDAWTWCWGTRAGLVHLLFHLRGQHITAAPPSVYPDYDFMGYECTPNDATKCNSFPYKTFNASVEGLSQETCRDAEHTQMGLAAALNAAETMRLQGTDLFAEEASRLRAGLEWHSRLLLGAPQPAFVCSNGRVVDANITYPTFEIGYNALANRLGLDMPDTFAHLVRNVRPLPLPENGWMMEWETLTHGGGPR